ncbi:hypothetical protein B0J13DRAFT_171200 [Dactylonectria estremocensis]|uniref:Uncharacterized protein n=1 Tax=Dactylonectria estremocensis TaxID=1079267 RepID=A0A9P9FB65_9HYPO|nr:hypothetical protein B0J13DRAFT_171200 [Dactylonectria estremocensis]
MSTPERSAQRSLSGSQSAKSPGSPSRPQSNHDVQAVQGSNAPAKADSDSGAENLTPADKKRFAPLPDFLGPTDLKDVIKDSSMDILKRSLVETKSANVTRITGTRYGTRRSNPVNDSLKSAIGLLPGFKELLTTEAKNKRAKMVEDITGEVEKVFSTVKANPNAIVLKELRVTVVKTMAQELDLLTKSESERISSYLSDLERRLEKAAFEADVKEKRRLDLEDEINVLEREKVAWEEVGRKSSHALHALESRHNETVIADLQENIAQDMVNAAVERATGRAQQAARVTQRKLFEPSACSPPDALVQLVEEVRGKTENPVAEFQQRGRYDVQKVHFAEPDTPGPESRQASSLGHVSAGTASELQDEDPKAVSSDREIELKQAIKAKDSMIANLQAQLALVCAAQVPQSAGGGASPSVKEANEPKGDGEPSGTPTYSFPLSPMTSALYTAQSLHKQEEMADFIRSLDNHAAQLQSTLQAYAAQEERHKIRIASLEGDLARGKPERRTLEELFKEHERAFDALLEGQEKKQTISSLHDKIRANASKLSTQIERNERVENEIGMRKQLVLSVQGQSGDLNNLVTFMKCLVAWFKTKNEQATSLQSELEAARSEIMSMYSPSTPGRPLDRRPLSARHSFKSPRPLTELTEEPSTGGSGGTSVVESPEQKFAVPRDLPAGVNTTEVESMPLTLGSVGTLIQHLAMNQFRAWQQVFMFNLALGRAAFRYLKDKYSNRPSPARDFVIPWFPLGALLLVLHHFQVLITIQVYVASRRQRDIWLSANALTREYMLRSVHEQPAWLFIPGLDRDLVLGGQELGVILGQAGYTVLLTAAELVRRFVVLLVHILVDPNYKRNPRVPVAGATL